MKNATKVVVSVGDKPKKGTKSPNTGKMNPTMIKMMPILLLKEGFCLTLSIAIIFIAIHTSEGNIFRIIKTIE
jgi:hypothetical protein